MGFGCLAGFAAGYDSLGRLTQYIEGNVDERNVYTAAPVHTSGAQSWKWTLDGVNNWASTTKDGAVSQGAFDADNKNLAAGPWGYDANGNLAVSLSHFGDSYTYDVLNRLTKAGSITYTYDAFNRRVQSESGGAKTNYTYDGVNMIESTSGGQTTRFVHGLGADEHIVMDKAGVKHYYVQDRLGNVVALTRSTGATAEAYLYSAYGETTVIAPGPNGVVDWGIDDIPTTASLIGNPYTYTGQQYDSATGLMYYKARYYDPVQGRFLNRDPIGVWGDYGNGGQFVRVHHG